MFAWVNHVGLSHHLLFILTLRSYSILSTFFVAFRPFVDRQASSYSGGGVALFFMSSGWKKRRRRCWWWLWSRDISLYKFGLDYYRRFSFVVEMNREEGRTGASIEEFLCKRPESSSSSSSFQHHRGNRSQLRISPPCVPSYFLPSSRVN